MRLQQFYQFSISILVLLSLGFITTGCNSDMPAKNVTPLEKIDYFDTKAIKRKYYVVDGRKEGKMIEYYPDGKVRAERNFKNDLEEGRTVYYFPSGNIREVQHFMAGEKNLGDTLWYDSGEIQFTADFKNSRKTGFFRKWSKEGEIVIEAEYFQDSLVKVHKGLFHKGEAMEVDTVKKVYPATPENASGG
ncbi:MAG: hypothetical protein IT259_12745 [Saprospiraceae bacterium]|nr:hypothetical protein [Saprospiraceae bacterium]